MRDKDKRRKNNFEFNLGELTNIIVAIWAREPSGFPLTVSRGLMKCANGKRNHIGQTSQLEKIAVQLDVLLNVFACGMVRWMSGNPRPGSDPNSDSWSVLRHDEHVPRLPFLLGGVSNPGFGVLPTAQGNT